MSRAATYPASTTGYAVVRLRNGNSYVGWTVYDGRSVTVKGSLRVIVNGVVEHRPRPRRTWQWRLVDQIIWDEQ